jgi:hypothetical protein
MNNELHHCAEWGYLEGVKQLVEVGANIEETNEFSMTALVVASLQGHFELVVYLVEHNANVAHADQEGETALHWACIVGNLSSVKCLLEHGASVTERDEEGKTALLHAAASGSLLVFQYLLTLEGGGSINETDAEGNTALLLASRSYHPPVVIWLLEFGGAQITDINIENASVWTVTDYSSLPRRLEIAYEKGQDGKYAPNNGVYVPNLRNGGLLPQWRHSGVDHDAARHGAARWPPSIAYQSSGATIPADRARRCATAGTAPSVPSTKAGPPRRPLPAFAATPGPGARVRGAHHHRRALGHGARGIPATC